MIKYLNKRFHTPAWLFLLLLFIFVLRIPSFIEPYYYGDEMIYMTLGEGIRQNVPLYSGLHDNKPPLLYLTAALAGNLFCFKVLLAIANFVSIYIFWKLTKRINKKNNHFQIIATSIFAIFSTLPLLEGNIANAELFMVGATIYALYLSLKTKFKFKNVFFAGILFSVGALYKIPAAFDLPVLIFIWFLDIKFNKLSILLFVKKSLILLLGFALPIMASILFFYAIGSGKEYLSAAFGQNVGYISSFRPDDKTEPFLVKNAPLLARALIVSLGLGILMLFRKKLSSEFIFASTWLLFSLFAVTLSERPYPHYLIQSLPPVALLLAMFFTYKTIEQSLIIFPLTLFFFVPIYYNFWHYPTINYYGRFYRFISKQITQDEYLSSFSSAVPDNYQIAQIVQRESKMGDKIFVWGGNDASIYALSRRIPVIKYTIDYHINDFTNKDLVFEEINGEKPILIVFTGKKSSYPELYKLLVSEYVLIKKVNDTEIWRIINNKHLNLDR